MKAHPRLQALLPPPLHRRLRLDAAIHAESVSQRLATILTDYYARPPIPDLAASQRRRLDAAIQNHESLEAVAATLRLTSLDAYAYVFAALKDGRLTLPPTPSPVSLPLPGRTKGTPPTKRTLT